MPLEDKNQVATTKKNDVALTGGLAVQNKLLSELEKANEDFGASFTPYGKTCAINCIAGIVSFCKGKGIELRQIDPSLLRLQVQNVGYTELNYASIPSEIYFDLRVVGKNKNEKGFEEDVYSISIKPQGAGNEKLVRKYGVGLKKGSGLHNAILIREGDEFIMPQFNGLEITPPVYKPQLANANNKVVAVMYPAEKEDGSVEYLIATRDSVKANLIAQIRQNTLYAFKEEYTGTNGKKYERPSKAKRDEFYKWLEEHCANMSVDDMLADEKLTEYINPTYTSGGSKEQMVLRKMKNNALKNYPKEYDNSIVKESVQRMFEEQDESVLEKKNIIKKVEKEIDDDLNEDNIIDFTADDEETPNHENAETPKDSGEEQMPF